jgi:hypothetical protein
MHLRLTTWLFFPAICFLALGCTRGSSTLGKPKIEENETVSEDPEAKPIRECYDKYRIAAVKGDQAEVLKVTDNSTLPWFRDVLELARSSNRDKFDSSNYNMRLCVVFLRQKFPHRLDEIKPEDAFGSFLEDLHDISQADLGTIRREKDDFAVARNLGPNGAYMWSFSKINGEWKVNFRKTMEMQGDFQAADAKQAGKPERELLLEYLRRFFHKNVNPKILDGPLP